MYVCVYMCMLWNKHLVVLYFPNMHSNNVCMCVCVCVCVCVYVCMYLCDGVM